VAAGGEALSQLALLLALGSAVLHVLWNAAARGASGRLRFMWLLAASSAVIALALSAGLWQHVAWQALWPYLLATSIVHAFYFTSLAAAYRTGELHWAYTLSRAGGVLLASLAALVLLGQRPSPLGWLAIALVLSGSVLVSGRPERPRDLVRVAWIALLIAAYTFIDSRGVQYAPPLLYIALLYTGATLLTAPFALRAQGGPGDRMTPIFGALSLASYLLLLYAYRLGPLAPTVAMRQTAPLLAAALGYLRLRERPTPLAWAGTALVVIGAILLA